MCCIFSEHLCLRIPLDGCFWKELFQQKDFTVIINCYKGKDNCLERGKYRGLKLAGQIIKIVNAIIKKLIRQQVNIDEIQFEIQFDARTWNHEHHYLETVTGEIFSEK